MFHNQCAVYVYRAVSTRLVAGMWWFFALIMTSSYTANLTASITSGRLETPIKNVDDLSKDSNIQYGCYEEGSTASFFQVCRSTEIRY